MNLYARIAPLSLALLFAAGCSDKGDDTAGDTDSAAGETGETGDTDTGTGAAYGDPLTSTDVVSGQTYSFLFANATISEPASLGAIITSYMTAPVMVGVQAVDKTSIDLVGALGQDGSDPAVQDTTVPVYDFPSSSFDPSSPSFSAGPTDATLFVSGISVTVYGLSITGTFAPDGTSIGEMTFSGTVDTAPIGPLLNGGGGETAVCDAAKNFGVSCVDCPDGSPLCLILTAVDIEAVGGAGSISTAGG